MAGSVTEAAMRQTKCFLLLALASRSEAGATGECRPRRSLTIQVFQNNLTVYLGLFSKTAHPTLCALRDNQVYSNPAQEAPLLDHEIRVPCLLQTDICTPCAASNAPLHEDNPYGVGNPAFRAACAAFPLDNSNLGGFEKNQACASSALEA